MRNILNEYTDEFGNCPYEQWLESIRDAKTRARIIMHVDKIEMGLFGDSQPVGYGLSELRIHSGPGYRVYYGKQNRNSYLLLCGGNKASQARDIKLAIRYWKDYERRSKQAT